MQNLTIEVDFDRFPREHTCDGEDISPRIRVLGSDAPYLAVIMDDPDAPRGTFTHWLAWNIPSTGEIPAGIPRSPGSSIRSRPSRGRTTSGRPVTPAPAPRGVRRTASSSGSGASRRNSTSRRAPAGPGFWTHLPAPRPATVRRWRSTGGERCPSPRPEPEPGPEGIPGLATFLSGPA